MEDFFDGYIFLKPFKYLTGCTYDDDFFTGKRWEDVKNNLPDPDWRTAADLSDYKRLIKDYIDIPKRYSEVIQTSIPTVQYGRIERINNFPSKYVISRNIDVWLPEGYNKKDKYAVLYMHDGQSLFDAGITWNGTAWRADAALYAITKQRSYRNCIIIGVWNTGANRQSEYFPQKPFAKLGDSIRQQVLQTSPAGIQSDAYLKFITQELKPYIDTRYATNADKANTFIAGSSMGGLISMYALCEYPAVFGGAACLSTHWIGDKSVKGSIIPDEFIAYLDKYLPDPLTHKIYFDYGTVGLDSLYEQHQLKADRMLRSKGYNAINLMSRKFAGADHSENAWSRRFQIPLQFLLKK
ncbi:esterase [Mucilaginibacter hurinus]|uniref:Esterase n=2 Tax=Mucilaginibacter hurinus TaxID=2201324 RepID=A0A367GSV1_9SPHI|nr:esterase [Mucilaginibacter hurinus]